MVILSSVSVGFAGPDSPKQEMVLWPGEPRVWPGFAGGGPSWPVSAHTFQLSRVRCFSWSHGACCLLVPRLLSCYPLSREAMDRLGLLPERAERKSRWAAFSLGLTGYMHVGVVASGKTRALPGVVTLDPVVIPCWVGGRHKGVGPDGRMGGAIAHCTHLPWDPWGTVRLQKEDGRSGQGTAVAAVGTRTGLRLGDGPGGRCSQGASR